MTGGGGRKRWGGGGRPGGPPPVRPYAGRRATLVTGALFAGILRETAAEFDKLAGTRMEVIGVLNERLGRGITVAGLLMGEDVLSQLKDRALGEFIVLPRG